MSVYIASKKIQINIACINKNAKDEIENLLSQQNLDIKDILKAYIQKAQDYAELQGKIADLVLKMETH